MLSRSNLLKLGIVLISGLFLSTTCEQSPTDSPSILSHNFDVLVMGAGGRNVKHTLLFSVPPKWGLDSVLCSSTKLVDEQISSPEGGMRWVRKLEISFSEQGNGPESEAEGIPMTACVPSDSLCLYFSEDEGLPIRLCSLGEELKSNAPDYR